MMASSLFLAVVVLVVLNVFVSGFSVNPRSFKLARIENMRPNSKTFNSKLFSEPDRRITRDNEEQYFESNVDKMTVQERLPLAIGFLGFVSIPFIVGLIYLYSNR